MFTPKPPRRIYPCFMFFDSLDEEEREQRPFPAKYPLELVFTPGGDTVATELLADGTCRDPNDGDRAFA